MSNIASKAPRDTVTIVALLTFATRPDAGQTVETLHEECDFAFYALDELEIPRNDMRTVGMYVRLVRLQLPVDSHEAELASENSRLYNEELAAWVRHQIAEYDAGTMPPNKIELFNRCAPGWNDADARRACGR